MAELNQVNELFGQGRNEQAYELLNQYIQQNPDDVEQLYRFAVLSEQLGTVDDTKHAYISCLRKATNNVLCYLYAGTYYLNIGEKEAGLAILSQGQDLDARLTMFYRYEQVAEQTKKRSYQADIALRNFYTEEHQKAISTIPDAEAVINAIWPQTHNNAFTYLAEQQRPHLFYLPTLTAQPFWPANEAFNGQVIEQGFDIIKSEFNALVDKIDGLGEPYLDEKYKQQGFDKLAGSANWTALHLFKDGILNPKLARHVPQTVALLKQLPLYGLGERPYEVFYSVLKAGQHITPHYGLSNHSLTVHLPITVPGDGYIKVADQQCAWQEGKLVAFDDSFIHEAINLSDADRVVLIFSVWHPELSDAEQKAIQRSFEHRQRVQAEHRAYFNKLL
ncbi:aspartyl/asparaginyl beta-hydroxylase domain-containing protein [Thalassotalea euphylliae]|uniref:Aspartyl/asparaginyl beta-hydroxylase domain-containing protein n=1 Tax=Thalassotalea euphylliae TaxID=1655234 RepID=A0A3E0UH15_9GAMM|nr:aspartyl/asparaginyl beta-hydroxylase domain-containing protein [Thalassotalea euphylliae]REL36160.1 aspartyl/asparaginyl beta-hydroxylase domain-containing protein [Thalassotalea euphylliae]